MSPFKKLPGVDYGPAELMILQRAYNETCSDMGLEPDEAEGNNVDDDRLRKALVIALVEAAGTGERDLNMLKAQALLTMSKRMV